MPEKV
jgi:hypothetical protein